MTEIILRSADVPKAVTVIRNAIDQEISRLEEGTEQSLERLKQFEDRYQVSSSEFAEHFAAEDLGGQDLEYIEWMGEYCLGTSKNTDFIENDYETLGVSGCSNSQ